jgi:hypothetical protein
MKKTLSISLALVAGLALGADPPDDSVAKELEQAITALNEAFRDRDAGKASALMAEDHLAVTPYYGGPLDRAGQLATISDLRVTEYKAGKKQVSPLGKDTVLVTYPLVLKGTFKGKAIPPRSYASAVWVRRDGKWLERFYQETALPSD